MLKSNPINSHFLWKQSLCSPNNVKHYWMNKNFVLFVLFSWKRFSLSRTDGERKQFGASWPSSCSCCVSIASSPLSRWDHARCHCFCLCHKICIFQVQVNKILVRQTKENRWCQLWEKSLNPFFISCLLVSRWNWSANQEPNFTILLYF